MKRILVLLFFPLALNAAAQSPERGSQLEMDTIDFPGQRQVFILHGTPFPDSIVETGTRQVSGATLAHVGTCTYKMTFRDTMLVETKVTVKGRKASRKLMMYYELLANPAVDPSQRGGFEFIPSRTIEHAGVPLFMELKRYGLRRKTTLMLTSDETYLFLE